ncbi:MAG: penicillin-binding protein, partial [Acidithiobacillus sp.]
WVGYDDNRTMGRWAAGAREALPIWVHYMRTAMAGEPDIGFFRPPDVVSAATASDSSAGSKQIGVSDYLAGYPPIAAPAAPTASTESSTGTDLGTHLLNTIKSLF